MSVQQAWAWIRRVRQRGPDPAPDPGATLAEVVAAAAAEGFRFTEDELRAAHRHDWALRWAAHGHAAGGGADASRASSARASEK